MRFKEIKDRFDRGFSGYNDDEKNFYELLRFVEDILERLVEIESEDTEEIE